MKVQRMLIAYTDHPYWEDIDCPVRILDDNGKVIFEMHNKRTQIIKINKLKSLKK